MLLSLQTGKEYRHSFVEEAIRNRIAAQIKTIREQRQWDFKKCAEEIGKKVSWVYRLEDPNEALPTIPTLLRLAEAFDVGLDVRFRSFSELLDDVTALTQKSFSVPSFDEELRMASFLEGRRRKRKIRCKGRRKAKTSVSAEGQNHAKPEGKVCDIGAFLNPSLAKAC